MTPVTYMTTMRGVNPLLTKGWCILLGLWDPQWVWNLVHVTFLTPIVLRRLQIFFFFLELGLTHPPSYVHICTSKLMTQCLKQLCVEVCRWISCWDSKQENISGNDNSKIRNQQWEHQTNKHIYYSIVASLSHDLNFNRVPQISITHSEPVCSRIYTVHQPHVLYHINICGLLTPHLPTLFHKTTQFSETRIQT